MPAVELSRMLVSSRSSSSLRARLRSCSVTSSVTAEGAPSPPGGGSTRVSSQRTPRSGWRIA